MISTLRVLVPALSIILTALPASAVVCRNGGIERTIYVVYAGENHKLPCKLKYTKSQASPPKVIFTASSDPGFCEARLNELVERLKAGGYTCDEE